MERKIVTKNDYEPSAGHRPVGVSQTVPRLSLSVSELVKRFTLTTLKEMEQRSLLTYDFGPDVNGDSLALLDRIDLSASSCIDITDVAELNELAQSQIREYQERLNEERQAQAVAQEQNFSKDLNVVKSNTADVRPNIV
jgi:hypothetical protein